MSKPPITGWRTCRVCGGAVPAGDALCPTCGQKGAVPIREIASLPRGPRRRLRLAQVFRSLIVVGVVVAITYAIVGAVLTGPPTFADPLTTRGTYTIAPGEFTYLSGAITGEDYIDGNYTILEPVGTEVLFQVYNSTGFAAFAHHFPTIPQFSSTEPDRGAIVFPAPYTDTFYLVFENPYRASSGIAQTIYIVTNYQSNVVIG
jgi:predicted nucleic acid-binding Zn ribbon protein